MAAALLALLLGMVLAAALSGCADAPQTGSNMWSDATCDFLREQSEAQVKSCQELCANEPEACNGGKACPTSDIRRWKEARPHCSKALYYPAPTWPPTNLLVE